MEINNNTADFAMNTDFSKVDIAAQSVTNQPASEQSKTNDLSSVNMINNNESTTQLMQKEPNNEQLKQVAADLTDMVAMMQKGLKFSVDDDSGKQVIKVQDIESGDIIRQIPSEEALKLAQKISEVSGVLMRIEV